MVVEAVRVTIALPSAPVTAVSGCMNPALVSSTTVASLTGLPHSSVTSAVILLMATPSARISVGFAVSFSAYGYPAMKVADAFGDAGPTLPTASTALTS